ncbi:hypothetical protein BCF11_0146 [Collimonas sp. PA-H2]|nr:hypothetical protein BCF11_0146 [Collimonas sp. PA-H2]
MKVKLTTTCLVIGALLVPVENCETDYPSARNNRPR